MATSTRMPLRTRLFGAALKLAAKEPTTAEQMVALRTARQKLQGTPLARRLLGVDAPGVSVSQRSVRLGDFDCRMLIHRPAGARGPLPVVVNFHGGGWCLGEPEQSRWLASNVAAQTGAVVISPSYRLAPEHPYPAAVDDAWSAFCWIQENAADLGADPGRMAVMGDSAGGNLAAVTALKARVHHRGGLRAQVLIYPAVEIYRTFASETANADAPLLTSSMMHTFSHLYLDDSYGDEDWSISPLRAPSHDHLPPALILTAGHDPLQDQGGAYADALTAAGVPVQLHDHPDTIHGFMSLPGVAPAARAGQVQIVEFLRGAL